MRPNLAQVMVCVIWLAAIVYGASPTKPKPPLQRYVPALEKESATMEIKMPTISEPLAEGQAWTFSRCRLAFQRGQIGEATLRVSLSILGLREQEIKAEIALAKMEMRR